MRRKIENLLFLWHHKHNRMTRADSPTNHTATAMVKQAVKGKPKAFRFNYSTNIHAKLAEFAEANMHLDRKSFKQAWVAFLEREKKVLRREHRRMKEMGYTKDFASNLYHNVRYYHLKQRVKALPPELYGGEKKKEGAIHPEKLASVTLPESLLEEMDAFILSLPQLSSKKPQDAFDEYNPSSRLLGVGLDDECPILRRKIKATFKNRYHKLRHLSVGGCN
jgi:hypothetical protein